MFIPPTSLSFGCFSLNKSWNVLLNLSHSLFPFGLYAVVQHFSIPVLHNSATTADSKLGPWSKLRPVSCCRLHSYLSYVSTVYLVKTSVITETFSNPLESLSTRVKSISTISRGLDANKCPEQPCILICGGFATLCLWHFFAEFIYITVHTVPVESVV